ncbi:SPOC like C-terminal domain-containing protein [Gilbertella persicaria]|uniref:SPOC like C-terminal domain-containing protein n=1 Tax=Gilbertella persicaria TaxID=101096 RepID=UPI00221E59D3|nr:SPOC like C-terminal domain-containing protein [Gilbertella persicaria]KAI8090950.1 SPOC like C-terminal domain-containing protein [Gilbertella persicaria]
MSYYNNSINFEDDDEYTEKESTEYNLKECTLYAIDCRSSMFVKDEAGNTPFQVALESIRSKLLDTLYTRPNDQVGIVLFSTRENKNMTNKDHIYILQTLDIPDASRIKELDLLIEDLSLVKQHYGSTDDIFPFSDFFWVCADIMSSTPKFATKRIILITDNDDPTGQNPVYRKTALQRAKDLNQVGVEHVLFGLDQSEHVFDKTLFYRDIVNFDDTTLTEDDFEYKLLSSTGKLKDLFEKIKTFQTTTRSEFRIPFHIAPHLTIGIKGFNMVVEKKVEQPKYFYTSGEQSKEVKATTRWRCVDTNEFLTPTDIKKSYGYGGEKIVFSEEDVAQIKTVNEPGLVVLGFRGQEALKSYHQISHPYFIYPDESQYKESKNVFCLLLKTLCQKKQLAICSLVRKTNALPGMVALLPQQETLDKNGNQIDPPGFQLIVLPYAEEIRSVPPYNIAEDYENGVEKAKILIEKLKITEGYKPMKYPNPCNLCYTYMSHLVLQNHKYMIQHIALENVSEKPADKTLPNYQFIESELSDDIKDFKQAVGLDLISACLDNHAKRKDEGEQNTRTKRIKSDMTIFDYWESNTLASVTNPSLKEFLVSVGIQPKKLKADLVEQVNEYFRSKQK